MNWVQRKIYLYNVTMGLYMLDWWERYLFNTLILVLMWFIFYNGSRNLAEFYRRSSNFFGSNGDFPSAMPDDLDVLSIERAFNFGS